MSTFPLLGGYIPEHNLSKVDFPDPFLPRIPKGSPSEVSYNGFNNLN